MSAFIVGVFLATYVGMAVGRVPGLRLDRTGIALVAAFALLAVVPGLGDRAGAAVDVPTLVVLASLMAVSGELELAGFYDRAAFALARLPLSPGALLAVVVVTVGGLSAVLTNDVVVFALTPMLVRGLRARGLDPRPFLLGAAAASNAGSAATVIGNPQNVLIAGLGHLRFTSYLSIAGPVAVASLGLTWLFLRLAYRGALRAAPAPADDAAPPPVRALGVLRGLAALVTMLAVLLVATRPAIGLGAVAAALLVSRVRPPRQLLERIDWPLLLLFVGLFIVTSAISSTGLPAAALEWLDARALTPARPGALVALCLLGANTIGNVPLVALLLAVWRPVDAHAFAALAVFSTLAGNLLVTGSVANLIVFERAAAAGAPLGFRDHARVGVPLTLVTTALAYGWLRLVGVV